MVVLLRDAVVPIMHVEYNSKRVPRSQSTATALWEFMMCMVTHSDTLLADGFVAYLYGWDHIVRQMKS